VVFDKTGTITAGTPAVVEMHVVAGTDEADLLALTGAAERRSEHPLAAAIASYAGTHAGAAGGTATVEAFEALAGRGARARVDGRDLLIGTEALLRDEGIDIAPFAGLADTWAEGGRTPVLVAIDARAAGAFAVADTIRPEAPEVIAALRARGLHVVMLTGDRRRTAEAIAREAGIDEVIAEVLPDGKVEAIRRLQQAGRRVAMIGDGLNDAPALAQADIGMAMASGTDIAGEAADVALMRDDLNGVLQAIVLAQKTMGTMKQNLFWAFAYNVVGIPIAAGILYPSFGLLLSPVLASAAMAFSSVSVVTNSLRLRAVRLQ